MIDGRPCLVIAINEHVEINGISVRPVPLADRKTAGEGAEDTAPWQEENGTQDPFGSDEIRPVATGSALQMKYKKKRILPLVL